MTSLQDAPPTPWDDHGQPKIGTYLGECVDVPVDAWFRRLDRVRRQKRWLWWGALDEEIVVGVAIVRTGYAANVFCWVFDRTEGLFHADVSRLLPTVAVQVANTPPKAGVVASYRALVEGFSVRRNENVWTLDGTVGDVRLDLQLRELAPPITAICPVSRSDSEADANVTRKQARASVSGTVRAGTRRFTMMEGAGFVDHSHGMLAGETIWQWAIGSGEWADGSPAAFNLVASFNDGLENVVWYGDEPRFVGPVEFELPEDRSRTWRVRGDGIDLELVTEGVRAQELDLGVVASDYVQPIGVWRGELCAQPFVGAGVAEDHRSVW